MNTETDTPPAGLAPQAAAPAADGAPNSNVVKIALTVPLKRASGDVAELLIRKPKAGNLRGLKVGELYNGDVGSVLAVLPRICDPYLTDAEVAELDPADLAEVAGAITGFFMTPTQKAMIAQMMGSASSS